MALIRGSRDPSPRELRVFSGIGLPGFFGLIGALLLRSTASLEAAAAVWIAGLALGLIGLAFPRRMRGLYRLMLMAFEPIGTAVSWLVLGTIYYAVLLPLALLGRGAGRDPLRLRRDPSAESYWAPRSGPREPERYFRQF